MFLRHSRLRAPLALATLLTFFASMLPPMRSARADDSGISNGATAAPAGAGFADGAAGLSNPGSASSAGNASGDARTSYPFRLPTARGGAQPSLELNYSSSAGVGFAGVGWTLNTPSIVRKGAAGLPKFRDDVPMVPTSDQFTIDGMLLFPVQTNPPLPAAISAVPGHPWVLYRREIDDGARYFYDGLTWVQQTKSGMRQFGTPLDGGTPSIEEVDDHTGNAIAGNDIATANGIIIYRWNLVRDTDVSGNTVFYVWDNESQLLGVNPRTAGTMFLTDIYDTASTPNPVPPGPPATTTCQGPSTRACGSCGTQTGTCVNGAWSWSLCQSEGACAAGTTQECGAGGVQVCDLQTCQWDACTEQTCPGPSSVPCGNYCGVSNGTCNNGTWSWSTCQQLSTACQAGTSQPCGNGGTQTCSAASCTWGTCTGQTCAGPSTQPCGYCGVSTGTCNTNTGTMTYGQCVQPPSAVCSPGDTKSCSAAIGPGTQTCDSSCVWGTCVATGSGALLDDVLGLFERSAYAQQSAPGGQSTFAHHVHLTWALPNFPGYPTAVTTQPGLVGPYAFSPIWKAPPFAQLTTVDVFSATSAVPRQLVREYQLRYTANATQTRTYLGSIKLVGDCDSVGGISEDGMSAAAVAACAAKEAYPPTTYGYYGVPLVPGGDSHAPQILSETPSYGTTAAADFLADLNGDAIADLVTGHTGMTGLNQCLDAWAAGCRANTGDGILLTMSGGLFGSMSCPCPNGAVVQGPDQEQPGSGRFQTASQNGLLTYAVDDSMWAFSVLADWTGSGRTSFLQTLPSQLTSPVGGYGPMAGTGYTNPTANLVFLGQFADPTPQVSVGTLMNLIGDADLTALEQAITTAAAGTAYGREVAPFNALDVDGDGLPDMWNQYNPGGTCTAQVCGPNTLFSTRDYAGVTHPFSVPVEQDQPPSENPSWAWGIGRAHLPGGTFTVTTTSGGSNIGDPESFFFEHSSAAHAAADIDGDGLADEVIANKFRADWNTTMLQFYNGRGEDYGTVGWNGGPANYLGVVVLPGRGDGRFGVAAANMASGGNAWNYDDAGNYVTPGASAPFAPYTYPGAGKPPFLDIGPIPPPQSDSLSPAGATSGYAMQSSAIRFGDLNGDGMADYAVLDGNGLHICLRYGAPWDSAHWSCVTESSLTSKNDLSDPTMAHETIMIGDVNGSGINRVIYFPAPSVPFGAPAGPSTAISVSPDGTSGPRDGLLETVSNGFGAQTSFTYATVSSLNVGHIPAPEWVVTSVTTSNGLAGTQAVEQQTSYSYGAPIFDARDRMFVGFRSVTATTTSDASGVFGRGSPGTVTKTTFATQTDNTCVIAGCAGAPEVMIHASRFLPQLVETSENSSAGTKFTTTEYTYVYQQPYVSLDVDVIPGQSEGRPGMVVSQQTAVTYPWSAGQTGILQSLPPAISFGANPWPPLVALVPSGGTPIMRQSSFDINANEVLTQDFGLHGVDVPIIRQSKWELPTGDTTGWSYRRTQSIIGYSDPSGTTVDPSQAREWDFAYDGQGRLVTESSPLTGGYQLPPPLAGPRAAGQPPTAVTSSSSLIVRAFQYDAYGNVSFAGNQDNRCATGVVYDSLFAQLPATVTAYPNGCGTPGLTTTSVFDRRIEAARSVLDPAARMTMTSYDDFGRVVEVDRPSVLAPGATTKVLTASYTDVAPVRVVAVQTGYGPDTGASSASGFTSHYRYVDGLGETRAVVDAIDPSTHGGQVWTVSGVHNSYVTGRTSAVYQPMFGSGPAGPGSLPAEVTAPTGPSASFIYDGLGRTTFAQDFNGNFSMTVYRDAALSADYYDAEQAGGSHQGAFSTVTRDGHGRVATTDAHWATGPNDQSGDLVTTTAYQATGEPTSISQVFPGGTTARTMTYDSLGRLVTNTEPNVGTWTYAYDAEGRLVGTSDARGCGENLFYDLGGRLLAADYSPCNATQAEVFASDRQAGHLPLSGRRRELRVRSDDGIPDPTSGPRSIGPIRLRCRGTSCQDHAADGAP